MGQVKALVEAAEEELGPVDILVSCAGVMYFTMMANAHVEEWDRTVDVNCKGLLNCLSTIFPGLGVYSASKAFVEFTLQALRLETAGSGLRVTGIQPGNTQTDLLTMSSDTEAVKQYGEASGAQILNPEDVAASIAYALRQPNHVSVNEILVEPREEPI